MNPTNPAKQRLAIIGGALLVLGAIAILIGFLTGASFAMGRSSLGVFLDLTLGGELEGSANDNSFQNVLALAGGLLMALGGVALLLVMAVQAVGHYLAVAAGLSSTPPAAAPAIPHAQAVPQSPAMPHAQAVPPVPPMPGA